MVQFELQLFLKRSKIAISLDGGASLFYTFKLLEKRKVG
jgi:hypothetical protein